MLFNLPRLVILNVFKEWLILEEIVFLDAALCNTQSRQLFLCCLEISEFAFATSCDSQSSQESLFWAWSRGVIVSGLFLDECVVQLLKNTVNLEKLYKVTNLKIRCDKQFKSFQILIETCTSLRRLDILQSVEMKVDKINNGNWLIPIFICLRDVSALSFTNVLTLNIKNTKVLAQTCTNLVEFSVDNGSLSAVGLEMVLEANQNISKLIIKNNVTITPEIFTTIAEHCPNIEDLELIFTFEYTVSSYVSNIPEITANISMMDYLTSLKTNYIYIFYCIDDDCEYLTDLYVEWTHLNLAAYMPLNDFLDVSRSDCLEKITIAGRPVVFKETVNLIMVAQYRNLTELFIVHIKIKQPYLHVIFACCELLDEVTFDRCDMECCATQFNAPEKKRESLWNLTYIDCKPMFFDDVIDVCKVYFDYVDVIYVKDISFSHYNMHESIWWVVNNLIYIAGSEVVLEEDNPGWY